MRIGAFHYLDDVVTNFGLDDARMFARSKQKRRCLNIREEQISAREPTEFSAGFGTVLPGQFVKAGAGIEAGQGAFSPG